MSANILTIAGSDSVVVLVFKGDLKSISATGAYGLSVITAFDCAEYDGCRRDLSS